MKKALRTVLSACSLGAALCLAMAPTSASAVQVVLELSLVVDESGSVDAGEFALQQGGYIAAFQSAAVKAAIASLGPDGIAVEYIQFDAGRQVGVAWTHLTDAASCDAFAAAILGAGRFGTGGTGVADAIAFARAQFGTEITGNAVGNGFESTRQVIDVSGDGAENQHANPLTYTDGITDAAIAAGIDKINGIVIDPAGEAGLLAFYQQRVQRGPGSFTLVADDFADFAGAVEQKIVAEVTNTSLPEGGSTLVYSLLSIGALGLLAHRRKNRVA